LLLRDYSADREHARPEAPAGETTLPGGVSAPLVSAKLARALLLDNRIQAAREHLSPLRGAYAQATFRLGGRLVTGADYAFRLDSHLAWTTLGTMRADAGGSPTYGGTVLRAGPGTAGKASTAAPRPGAPAWTFALPRSSTSETARIYRKDDKRYPHCQTHPVLTTGRAVITTQESVHVLDAMSGQLVWRQTWNTSGSLLRERYSGWPVSCPTAGADKVWLRVLADDRAALRCYETAGGKQVWSTESSGTLKNLIWLSDPLIAYGMAVGVFMERSSQGDDKHIHCVHGVAALDAETGELRWQRRLASGTAGFRVCVEGDRHGRREYAACRGAMQLGPPAADGGVVYTATGLGGLAALNAFTGEVLWLTNYPRLKCDDMETGNAGAAPFQARLLKVNARGPASPVLAPDVVVLAPKDAAGVMAFDRKTGEVRWARGLMDGRYVPGICENTVLVADTTVTALALATGAVAWEYSLGGRGLLGQPGYYGGVLYLPTQADLQLLDARTGQALSAHAWDNKAGPLANLVVTSDRIVGVSARLAGALSAK
jgi:outer membrane protein assembly factor BamB